MKRLSGFWEDPKINAYCRVLGVIILTGGATLADEAVSPAFTFDARYAASGVSPSDWVAYQVEEISSRFTALTTRLVRDENKNGISDAWEELYGLSGANAAAGADPDGDGRTNLQEYNAGTSPIVAENYAASRAVSAAWTLDTWIASMGGGGSTLLEVWAISSAFTVDTA